MSEEDGKKKPTEMLPRNVYVKMTDDSTYAFLGGRVIASDSRFRVFRNEACLAEFNWESVQWWAHEDLDDEGIDGAV